MPLYDYKCTKCGETYEIRHGFDETHAEACAACGGTLARVFNPAPIVFKGAGFYVTDSRKSSSAGSSKPAESAATSTPAEPAKTESKPASKPDAPKASEPAA